MLVIQTGNSKDFQLSGFPGVGNLPSQPVKNGAGPSVYKGLVPKPAAPPPKVSPTWLATHVSHRCPLSYCRKMGLENVHQIVGVSGAVLTFEWRESVLRCHLNGVCAHTCEFLFEW